MPDMTKEVLFEIVNRDVFQNDTYKDIVVEDDNDSRRITFSIARYYDEVDLSTKNVVVRYVNALSQYDEYLVYDAHAEGDKVFFTWLVHDKALLESGQIEFDVLFYDVNGYKWHTKPANLTVERGLISAEYIASPETSNLYSQWRIEAVQNLKESENARDASKQYAQNSANSANASANSAQNSANSANASANSAQNSANSANASANSAQNSANSANAANESKDAAAASAKQSADNVILSKSWAVGGTGIRVDEDNNNAKYFAEQAQGIAQGAMGYYTTPEALKAAHPTSEVGFWAIVGSTDSIWVWDDASNDWIDTHKKTDLSDYYTKSQTEAIIDHKYTAIFSANNWTYSRVYSGGSTVTQYSQTAAFASVSGGPAVTASSIVMGEPAYEPSQDYSTNVELQDAFDVMCQGGNYAIIGNNQITWYCYVDKPAQTLTVDFTIRKQSS